MHERKWLWALAAVLASGLIAAGCGGDDEGDAGDDGAGTEAESGDTGDTTAPEGAPENVDEVIERCKESVEASPVEGDTKEQALEQCEQIDEAVEGLENLPEDINPEDINPEDFNPENINPEDFNPEDFNP